MTKTQRNILLFLPLQALVVFMFFYLTRYWVIGIILQVGLALTMVRRSLAGGNFSMAVAKSAQPIIFIVFASLYSMLLVQIYGVSIPFFAALSLVIVLGFGMIAYLGLRSKVSSIYAGIVGLTQIILVTNFIVLAMAYWRLPGVIALPITFVASLALVGWWLIESLRDGRDVVVISSIWAFIVSELVWIYSHWIVVYQLPALNLVVAQAAVVIGALSYSVGGIYYNQRKRSLRLQLLIEYVAVFVIVFVATLLTTRWGTGF